MNTRRSLGLLCVVVAMAACLLPARAQPAASPIPLSTLIDHDTQILTFVCGGPLTADERQRFAAAITEQVRRNPNYWYDIDKIVVQDLQFMRESPAIRSEQWVKWRLNYAFQDVEGTRIAAAHDPIIVMDRQSQVVITEHTLRSLSDAATWVARQTGRPTPSAQYIVNLRNTVRQQWRTWSKDTLSALTRSPENFPAAVEYTSSMTEASRKQLFKAWGDALHDEPQSTISSALMMSKLHGLLIDKVRNMASPIGGGRSSCDAVYGSNPYTTGTGAFCSPWETHRPAGQ